MLSPIDVQTPPTHVNRTDLDVYLLRVPHLRDDVHSFLALGEQHPDLPVPLLACIVARPADERPALLDAIRRETPTSNVPDTDTAVSDPPTDRVVALQAAPAILGRRRREQPSVFVYGDNDAGDRKRSRLTEPSSPLALVQYGGAATASGSGSGVLQRRGSRPLVLPKDSGAQLAVSPLSPAPEDEIWETPCGDFQFIFPPNLKEPPPPLPSTPLPGNLDLQERALVDALENSLNQWKATRDLSHWEQYDRVRRQLNELRQTREQCGPTLLRLTDLINLGWDELDWASVPLHPVLSPPSFLKQWRSLEEEKQRHERRLQELVKRRRHLQVERALRDRDRLVQKQLQQAKLGEELRKLEELQQLRRIKHLQRVQQLMHEHEMRLLDHEIRKQRIKAQNAALSLPSPWGDLDHSVSASSASGRVSCISSPDPHEDRITRLLALDSGWERQSTTEHTDHGQDSRIVGPAKKGGGRFQERKKWFQQALLTWQSKSQSQDEDREDAGAAQAPAESSAWSQAWQAWHLWRHWGSDSVTAPSASAGDPSTSDGDSRDSLPGSPDPFVFGGSFFSI